MPPLSITRTGGAPSHKALFVSRQALRRFVLGQQGLWPGRRWQGKTGLDLAVRAGFRRFLTFLDAGRLQGGPSFLSLAGGEG